ncbi:MAG: PQQ-binding-like beta-propeller repeat protein [Firmicutes bacterium]|nr:PQQ-binding-like beta-propeller repeat protein [Bacillota bacterium]
MSLHFTRRFARAARRFALGVLAGILILGAAAPAWAAPGTTPAPKFWFAFVSDSHLGSPQGNKWSTAIPDDIRAHGLALGAQAAFIAHGGDMTEFGTRDEYARYQETLATAGRPVYGVPGNHESKWGDAGKSGFRYALGKTFTSFDYQGIHFVFLDTSVDGETYGHLEKYMLDWLKQDLKRAAGKPAVIFSHHPIGYSVSRFIDNDYDFFEAVAPFNVKAVFTGHGHSTLKWTVNGIPCFMAPAAMDGQYLTVRVDGGDMTVFSKAVGADPSVVATVGLGAAGGSRAPVKVQATIAQKELQVKAEVSGVSPVSAKYRVDLGPWKDLTVVSAGRPPVRTAMYSACDQASSLPEGVHNIYVRVEAENGDAWIGRCEVTVDRTPAGRTAASPARRVLWRYSGRGGVQGSPAVLPDLILFGSNDGLVTALRRSDGRQKWQFKADGGVPGRITVVGQQAYFGTAAGSIYCIDLRKGTQRWRYPVDSSVVGGVVVSGGRVLAGTTLGWVHSINAATGKPAWKQRLGGAIRSMPSVDAGRVFVGAWDGKVHAMSEATGELQWTTVIDASPYYSAATGRPLAANGVLYVTSPANAKSGGYGVAAIDQATGSIFWRAAVNAGYSEPFLHEGELVVTDSSGTVHFLDRDSGVVKGVIKGGGPCLDSSAVPGPAGRFITGTTTGQVRFLSLQSRRDPAAGSPESPQPANDAAAGAAPEPVVLQVGDGFVFARIAVSGQTAYACTMSGDVYALNLTGLLTAAR